MFDDRFVCLSLPGGTLQMTLMDTNGGPIPTQIAMLQNDFDHRAIQVASLDLM